MQGQEFSGMGILSERQKAREFFNISPFLKLSYTLFFPLKGIHYIVVVSHVEAYVASRKPDNDPIKLSIYIN